MNFEDNLDWETYHMSAAYTAARKSKDTRTQVGAVIVGPDHETRSTGYNGLCRGMDDADMALYTPEMKELFFEHAERNAIFNAALIGVSTKNCTMYVTLFPCPPCARAIAQAGISKLVIHKEAPIRASTNVEASRFILAKRRVQIIEWSGKPLIDWIRFDGKQHYF